jgi:hypothetical protein
MFDRLVWQKDRMLLGDLVFRLEHYTSTDWELGDEWFLFYKTKPLVDQYAKFWALRPEFRAEHILELGVWDGGSIVFWFEHFRPSKHVGVDIQTRKDSEYFRRYVSSQGLEGRIKTYWGTDQADSGRLREIAQSEFSGLLDLVIDDASHLYDPTRRSFETLFPLLRPGGLYVIEDWAWGHWREFQTPGHPWTKEIPLTRLIAQLIEATGSESWDTTGGFIGSVTVFQGFAVVERGDLGQAAHDQFDLEKLIRTLVSAAAPGRHERLSRIRQLVRRAHRLINSRAAGAE